MRLLNIYTLDLKVFHGNSIPRYYILSHRWSGDETTFQDFSQGLDHGTAGREKIWEFCRFIRSFDTNTLAMMETVRFKGTEPIQWVWIDTCCIDKRSSAEISEAINSMWNYYRRAWTCIAYLADVHPLTSEKTLNESEWFSRGWTLQELLAPFTVVFCDSEWNVIGHKCSHLDNAIFNERNACQHLQICGRQLNETISRATDIDEYMLMYPSSIRTASVACRMSWMAKRTTTRPEDIAYSMLGLFGVHLPPLYGEGRHAFVRLQEEIINRTGDHSIFTWFCDERYQERNKLGAAFLGSPTLASSPACFARSGSIERVHSPNRFPFSVTNAGVQIRAMARAHAFPSGRLGWSLRLNCTLDENSTPLRMIVCESDGIYCVNAFEADSNLQDHNNANGPQTEEEKLFYLALESPDLPGFWGGAFWNTINPL